MERRWRGLIAFFFFANTWSTLNLFLHVFTSGCVFYCILFFILLYLFYLFWTLCVPVNFLTSFQCFCLSLWKSVLKMLNYIGDIPRWIYQHTVGAALFVKYWALLCVLAKLQYKGLCIYLKCFLSTEQRTNVHKAHQAPDWLYLYYEHSSCSDRWL